MLGILNMFKGLSKAAVFTIFVLASFCSFAQSSTEQKLFFERPTIVQFNEFIKQSLLSATTKQNMGKALVFYATAFRLHPSLSKEVIANFANYDLSTQELLYSGLVAANIDLPSKFKSQHESTKIYQVRDVVSAKFNNKYTTMLELENNMHLVDLHWAAFYASGDPLYIEKILKFLTAHSELTKDISREYTNRDMLKDMLRHMDVDQSAIDYDDLINAAKEHKIIYQVMGHKTVSWSIRSNANTYSSVNKTIEKLCNKNKKLETW